MLDQKPCLKALIHHAQLGTGAQAGFSLLVLPLALVTRQPSSITMSHTNFPTFGKFEIK